MKAMFQNSLSLLVLALFSDSALAQISAVPEPTTMALLAVGAGAAIIARKIKK